MNVLSDLLGFITGSSANIINLWKYYILILMMIIIIIVMCFIEVRLLDFYQWCDTDTHHPSLLQCWTNLQFYKIQKLK